MTGQEEYLTMINHFLEKAEFRVLIIYQSAAGLLVPANSFPDAIKFKTIYFVKRQVCYSRYVASKQHFMTL